MSKRFWVLFLTSLLAGCGGGTTTPPPPPCACPAPPITSGSESIAPEASATLAPLPSIGGIYGGQIVLPPGSGTAMLTFSLNAPAGVVALTELTPQPQIAYITITAQSPFTLAALPGLNLTVPPPYTTIDMWLNTFGSGGWSRGQLAWPGPTSGDSVMCFATSAGGISLQQGQSLYLGINGDNVLPTPMPTGTPPPCPQSV